MAIQPSLDFPLSVRSSQDDGNFKAAPNGFVQQVVGFGNEQAIGRQLTPGDGPPYILHQRISGARND